MASAFMADLNGIRGGIPGRVVRRDGHLGAGPFVEDGEEAGDVLGDLAGVLAAQVTPEARLPDLARPIDQIIVCRMRRFHRRPHGRLRAAPCLWPPASASDR